MNKLRRFFSRYRLISNALALAFVLAALTVSSQPSSAFTCSEPMICGQGCVNWTQAGGCSECQRCCACGEDYQCTTIQDRTCELTY
jgi:hypothetical protein